MTLGKLLYLLFPFLLLNSCVSDNYIELHGKTMGTTYSIIYQDKSNKNYQPQIDSVLKEVNLSLSTYIPNSVISKFNQSRRGTVVDDRVRIVNEKATEVAKETNGAFDPTVMPLVNAWGFGFEKEKEVDSQLIDSLLNFVGYMNVKMVGDSLIKQFPQVMLDFSAIAKGYGVDEVARFLESKQVNNYMVEIGGEVRVKGKNSKNKKWHIGIDKPIENTPVGNIKYIFELGTGAMATSGNYRNFRYENGKKYAHTINPHTGYPVEHNLLSATVVANDCMTADAFATSFMVMGTQKAIEFCSSRKDLAIILIYENKDQEMTAYISDSLKELIHTVD